MILEVFLILTYVVGDTVTTYHGLKLGAIENNPAINFILVNFGYFGMVTYKLFAVIYIIIYAPIVVPFAVAASLFIVVGNLVVIWRFKNQSNRFDFNT